MFEARNLEFAFPATGEPLLVDVCLSVQEGELVVITGENGAGKTTLGQLCAGRLTPRRGSFSLQTAKSLLVSVPKIPAYLAAVAPQCLPRITEASLGDLLTMQSTRGDRHAQIRAMSRVRELWQGYDVDLTVSVDDRLADLPSDQLQLTIVGAALLKERKVLVFDEPTSFLDPIRAAKVWGALLNEVSRRGAYAVAIAHPQQSLPVCRTHSLAAGRLVPYVKPSPTPTAPSRGRAVTECSFHMLLATVTTNAEHVEYSVARSGEITWLHGPPTRPFRTFCEALLREETARARLRGNVRSFSICRIPADASEKSLAANLSVRDNAVINRWHHAARGPFGLLHHSDIDALAKRVTERAGVSGVKSLDELVDCLSGGNRQRLVISRESFDPHAVIVAEEPFRGLDDRGVETVAGLFCEAARAGSLVLILTASPPSFPWIQASIAFETIQDDPAWMTYLGI
ncbi:MAG: hypothetical protein C0497_06380 [Gemmatimonas sp.]|nr:hypothetical protein [Gemmatimonas sp.]